MLVIASDEKTMLTDALEVYLKEKGHELILLGHLESEDKKWKWADIGKEASQG